MALSVSFPVQLVPSLASAQHLTWSYFSLLFFF